MRMPMKRYALMMAAKVAAALACRVDALRACGNGVVPLQAALALRVLVRRAWIDLSFEES